MTEVADAIVVGGGPGGCAMALFLKQQGHHVLLLDEARFPRDKVCGEGVSPESWRLLDRLGLAHSVRALSPHPLRGMRLTSPDGTTIVGDYRGASVPGFALRRERLDQALIEGARAGGVAVLEGVRATDILREGGAVVGVVGETAQGPTGYRARLVVGADGRRSLVARRLGLLREHPSLRKFAVRGYWDGVEGLEERGEMHVGGGGYCGVAPLSPSSANITFVLDREEMSRSAGNLTAFYRTTLGRWPALAERLGQGQLQGTPRAIGPLALVAHRISVPGALLVGDAAGFYDPFTGEGVTLALRSAELASEVAARALGRGRIPLLSEYDQLRHAATRDKFRLNRLLQRIVAWPALANLVARRLVHRPQLTDRLVGIAGDFVPARTALGWDFLWELIR